MEFFKIDFELLVKRLVPSFLFVDPLTSWFKALLKPLVSLNDDLLLFVYSVRKTISYNSQTRIFEEYLNDLFDPISKRIYIKNTFSFTERIFIFFRIEANKKTFSYFRSEGEDPIFLKFNEEFSGAVDFVVFVPSGLTFDSNKMNLIIKETKLAGKRYKIELF